MNKTPETKKKPIVFLSGVGGVGKTSVLNRIIECAPQVTVCPSVTRLITAKHGYNTEQLTLDLPEEKRNQLQTAIFRACIKQTLDVCRASDIHKLSGQSTESDLIVVDRSVFDHASYKLMVTPSSSLAEVRAWNQSISDFFAEVSRYREVHIFRFPYPAPWIKDDVGSLNDTYRVAPAGKNFIWNSILDSVVRDWVGLNCGLHTQSVKELSSRTIQGRAYEILGKVLG